MRDEIPARIPQLFYCPPFGTPFQFYDYIHKQQLAHENEVRALAGEPESSISSSFCYVVFCKEAVERISRNLLAVAHEKRSRLQASGKIARADNYIKSWSYLLQSYCKEHEVPAPDVLIELTFVAMDLKEFHPDARLAEEIGLSTVTKPREFRHAAVTAGIADAKGEKPNISAMARKAGVDNKLIREWMTKDEFADIRLLSAAFNVGISSEPQSD